MSHITIITGLPRSGTSVTAGIARICGLDLGTVNESRVPAHPTGVTENDAISSINHAQLLAQGYRLFDPPWHLDTTKIDFSSIQRVVNEQRGERDMWGFKDPRIVYLLSVYERLYPIRIIVTTRGFESWLDAVHRYAPLETDERMTNNYNHFQAWLRKVTKSHLHHAVVPFETVVKNPLKIARKLCRFLGTTLTKDMEEEVLQLVIQR